MKVVHLVSGSLSGGAARGAYWLHKGLLSIGVDSVILLGHYDDFGDSTVVPMVSSKFQRLFDFIKKKFDKLVLFLYPNRKKIIFSSGLFGTDLLKHPEVINADIINLHWVNNAFISVSQIKKFKQPVVWTVRDMWPITGGCHYSLDCNHYLSSCGNCPILSSQSTLDLSRLIFLTKQKNYKASNLTFVGISEWISGEIRKSQLSNGKKVLTISNTIDSEEFLPINSEIAKQILCLDNKPTILVGAKNTKDFYKGSHELIEVIQALIKNIGDNFQLLVFGIPNEVFSNLPIVVKQLGFLSDIYSLRLAYSAADLFIAPSKMETFGKTIAESMSCETPVVAFDSTGPKDIISHLETGYLAAPNDIDDMLKGVLWLLSLDQKSKRIVDEKARLLIESKFSPLNTASKYKTLYQEILNEPNR